MSDFDGEGVLRIQVVDGLIRQAHLDYVGHVLPLSHDQTGLQKIKVTLSKCVCVRLHCTDSVQYPFKDH